MAMLEIPLSSDAPHFSQEHQIFGHIYTLEFEWIEREQYWTLHLYGEDETPIALGLRVNTDWPIFCDQNLGLSFLLTPKNPNAKLDLKTLYGDFMLVAYEIV